MKKAPEKFRIKGGFMRTDESYGNNGVFYFPHFKVKGYDIRCIISDGEGWEHVSVTVARTGEEATRNPTWDEMCRVKAQFWDEDECVIEYHPAKSEYVSCHPFCLHLWKPIGVELPIPDSLMVGPKEFIKS